MSKRVEVIIIRETALQSIISDTYSLGGIIAAVLLGVWLESQALQWFGALAFILGLAVRAAGGHRMTVAEARDRLDEIEKGRSK